MLITSHLAATVAVSRWLGLSVPELSTALAGGVLLDLDHLVVNGKWFVDVKNFLRSGIVTHGEVKQHSWLLQEPLCGLIVGALTGLAVAAWWPQVRWWVFPFFQGMHIIMDGAMRYRHEPLMPFSRWSYRGWIRSNSKTELAVSSAILAAILLL